MKLLMAVLCVALGVSALAQPVELLYPTDEAVGPRVGLPSAHLLPKGAADGTYDFRWASWEGRDLVAHQFGAAYGVTQRIELSYDHHDINVDGRTAGHRFDTTADGLQVRYGTPIFAAPGALFVQYRTGSSEVVTGAGLRIPPDSDTISFGAVRSDAWGDDRELHLIASATRSTVGSQEAWTFLGGAGLDYDLGHNLTAMGDLAVTKETGDISSAEVALAGGMRYERRGFHAAVTGTLLPSGAPLAGNALGDASVFAMDPVFAGEPLVRDFQSDSVAFFTVQVGYTTSW
jgi:hypothetical protein